MGYSGFSRMHSKTDRAANNKQHKDNFIGAIDAHFNLIFKQIDKQTE